MIRLTVERQDEFIILVIDNANTMEELLKFIDQYFENIDYFAKSSNKVIFKIDELDGDGKWLDFAKYWLARRGSICFVYGDQEVESTIPFAFGSEATFHKTVEDAMKAAK